MTNISIIGAGRLGTSLGYALSKKGYRIKALSCRTLSSAKESRQIIGEGIASNFFVVLLDLAVFFLQQIGLQEEKALQMLLPLVKGTLHNVKKFNIRGSSTGPAIRGDHKSIQKHLDALRNFSPYYETYKRLTAQALETAKREKELSPQKIKVLENLLEGK